MERTEAIAARLCSVGRGGFGAGLLVQRPDDGVQLRIHRVEPREVRVDRLARGKLLLADQVRGFGGVEGPERFGHLIL